MNAEEDRSYIVEIESVGMNESGEPYIEFISDGKSVKVHLPVSGYEWTAVDKQGSTVKALLEKKKVKPIEVIFETNSPFLGVSTLVVKKGRSSYTDYKNYFSHPFPDRDYYMNLTYSYFVNHSKPPEITIPVISFNLPR